MNCWVTMMKIRILEGRIIEQGLIIERIRPIFRKQGRFLKASKKLGVNFCNRLRKEFAQKTNALLSSIQPPARCAKCAAFLACSRRIKQTTAPHRLSLKSQQLIGYVRNGISNGICSNIKPQIVRYLFAHVIHSSCNFIFLNWQLQSERKKCIILALFVP